MSIIFYLRPWLCFLCTGCSFQRIKETPNVGVLEFLHFLFWHFRYVMPHLNEWENKVRLLNWFIWLSLASGLSSSNSVDWRAGFIQELLGIIPRLKPIGFYKFGSGHQNEFGNETGKLGTGINIIFIHLLTKYNHFLNCFSMPHSMRFG